MFEKLKLKASKTVDVGRYGEKAACRFLKKKGYKIIDSNRHESHKEIDIIAQNKKHIVFVEVKTRSVSEDLFNPYGTPASAVNKAKQSNLIFAARSYLRNNRNERIPRMDVIEVYLNKGTSKILKINHYENAFHA